ncbi:transcription factor Adf-1 [Acyrthosiphon pisum]|uniref:MADF domain-containing protein n=1 Tax=Acyrthosiphon pisum TaxID=7029 RepID=A0A8R2B6I5_ACYPI|nr:transcription factor Adf-1 [Acyrthosiphon pisum]XP_016660403.1 transcription factor Adf-1 [Acyrthosiphon pisum]|eukprot:XP_008183728.1 PREDICTED: transcription factor Adf-1 [Acyrthosiphon pisum]
MTEQLIELVRKHTFLYDTSCKSYKNVGLKDETWKNIGHELNENDEVLKKKWKSIRDNYLRYKKEINDTTGQATRKYQNWPWASQLKFLDKFLAPRQTTSNITTDFPLEIQIQELTSPSQITSPFQASISIFDVEESDDPQLYTRTDSTLPAPKKIKTNSKEPNNQPVGVYLGNKKKHTYDSVDHLFLSYAGTFKKFSERNQIKVKVELAKLFADMELKELDERGPSSSLSLHTPMSNYSNDSDFSQPKTKKLFKT